MVPATKKVLNAQLQLQRTNTNLNKIGFCRLIDYFNHDSKINSTKIFERQLKYLERNIINFNNTTKQVTDILADNSKLFTNFMQYLYSSYTDRLQNYAEHTKVISQQNRSYDYHNISSRRSNN